MLIEQPSKEEIFKSLMPFLTEPSPFVPDSPISVDFPQMYFKMDFPILVIGAGGLGCQILKNLALTGFNLVHVVDLDTIDVTNLNRQFLFRQKDIGRYKAEVAAEFIMRRVPTCKVVPHTCKIQQLDDNFYKKFMVVIAGLDNVQARRWLNVKLHQLVEFDQQGQIDLSTKRVLIDGGTEQFGGQVFVVKPFETSCYECFTSTIPQEKVFNSCTIANTPRIPEHCIQYVREVSWPKEFGDKVIDTDSKEDILYVYRKALQRADGFGIKGVTQQLTLGVLKNIIPAIASTNCLIAAACTNEAFKLTTSTNPTLDNVFYYKGKSFIGSETYSFQAQNNCIVCSSQRVKVSFPENSTLRQFLQKLGQPPYNMSRSVCIQTNKGYLVMPVTNQYDGLLDKTFHQLIAQKLYSRNQKLNVSYVTEDNITKNSKICLTLE